VGLAARPYGLCHTAITAALDLTGDLRVLTRYDDNRTDLDGDVAKRVAATA